MQLYKYNLVQGIPRILIRSLDVLFLCLFLFLIFFLTSIPNLHHFRSFFSDPQGFSPATSWQFQIQMIFAIITPFLYFVVLSYLLKGRTLAKLIFKAKVVNRQDLKPLSFWATLKREIFIIGLYTLSIISVYFSLLAYHNYNYNFISTLETKGIVGSFIQTLYFSSSGIVIILIIFLSLSKKSEGLHDKLAKSVVIYKNPIEVSKKEEGMTKALFFTHDKIDISSLTLKENE